ncbi:MAG TPA: spherulation-specific family 4 protein [Nitrososphaera sp.]|nr:spherulation-specific family 4 protein [Nitrososphaera sp.]
MQTTQRKSYLTIIIVVSAAIAAAMMALFALPLVKVAYANVQNLYVIYYGHLVNSDGTISEQASRIIEARPQLVIVPYSFPDGTPNLTDKVHQQFKDAGIKVLTYTWTKYGERNIDEVKADIDSQLAAGVDGIFVDEVTNISTDKEYSYYSAIYKYVKSHDSGKLVVMNPGHYKVTEKIMQISDIVSLEEEWVYHGQIAWKENYPPARFMGVSSNEYCTECITAANAAEKTLEAWNSGIGYHFATDRYIDLPEWFSGYASQVNEVKQP